VNRFPKAHDASLTCFQSIDGEFRCTGHTADGLPCALQVRGAEVIYFEPFGGAIIVFTIEVHDADSLGFERKVDQFSQFFAAMRDEIISRKIKSLVYIRNSYMGDVCILSSLSASENAAVWKVG
jgi:hypothetical protein